MKSDTEYECVKQKNELSEKAEDNRDSKWSWTWGELPTPPSNPPRSNTSSRQGHVDSSKIEEATNMQSMNQTEGIDLVLWLSHLVWGIINAKIG